MRVLTKKCLDCEKLVQDHNERCGPCYHKRTIKKTCLRGHDRSSGVTRTGNCVKCLGGRRSEQNWVSYGIKNADGSPFTVVDYDRAYQIQQGRCANLGCRKHQSELARRLHTDHDHKTGLFRGLLCSYCNSGLGMMREDVEILIGLVNYLKR